MRTAVYLVRHAEIEHHRTDVSLTALGYEQAAASGAALADRIREGDTVFVYHSPVTRVQQTANVLYQSLTAALAASGRAARVTLHQPQPDSALCNPGFIVGLGREPVEPSLVYAMTSEPDYLEGLPAARAEFYRGFWASADPMGYWLTHDSGGGAESPAAVLARLRERLRDIFSGKALAPDPSPTAKGGGGRGGSSHWIMVTHAGTMRALLQPAFGTDPGEPDFCEAIVLQLSGQADPVTLSYRGRVALLDITPR